MATKQVTRNIALTPHFDQFVKQKVDSGRYQSASEVVREGLRLMEQAEQERQSSLADVRQKIHEGYLQVKNGQTVDPDDVLKEIAAMSKAGRKTANGRQSLDQAVVKASAKPNSKSS
jgi:antitoxin ParD1/3/4